MSNGMKLLLMAAGAVITCIVVVVGFNLAKSGKSDTTKAQEQYSSILNDYDMLKDYDGQNITGSALIELMDSYRDDSNLSFLVKTKESVAVNGPSYIGTYYSQGNYNKSTVRTNEDYINPDAFFKMTVITNDNGIVTQINANQI